MKTLFTTISYFYCATNDVCIKINSLLLIEATLWCFIRVEDIIKINSTYNIIQSLVLSFTQLCIFIPPLSLFFILLCLPMAVFPFAFLPFPFAFFLQNMLLQKRKTCLASPRKCRQHYYNEIIITCRDRTLASLPHLLTFPHLKLKCSFSFPPNIPSGSR